MTLIDWVQLGASLFLGVLGLYLVKYAVIKIQIWSVSESSVLEEEVATKLKQGTVCLVAVVIWMLLP